jgi:hypothetical protein
MLRLALGVVSVIALPTVGACSDLGATPCSKQGCGGVEIVDPPAKTRTIDLACANNVIGEASVVEWELTVDPGPILASGEFGASFAGKAAFDEHAMDRAQTIVPGGYKRINLVALKATVHVRDGITEGHDVVLRYPDGGETCAYDDDGRAGPTAGPEFPSCYPENDAEDGSNADCTGLGGAPDPRNPCGRFVSIPWSDDGERCAELGKAVQWANHGFCVTGGLEAPLAGDPAGYIAAEDGLVLFGWDDESTSATLEPTARPEEPTWTLNPPNLDEEPGPNSVRMRVRYDLNDEGEPLALECTMASGPPGLLRRTPDSALISFLIQTREQ